MTIQGMIDLLNLKLTEPYLNETHPAIVEDFIRAQIEAVFGVSSTKSALEELNLNEFDVTEEKMRKFKQLYHKLSRIFHADTNSNEPFMSALKTHKKGNLPFQLSSDVWHKIQYIWNKKSPSTEYEWSVYRPVDWIEQKYRRFFKLFEGEQKTFEKRLQAAFPEWYEYEQYPEYLHFYINVIQFGVNTVLLTLSLALGLKSMVTVFLDFLTITPLLAVATQQRYLQYDAERLFLQSIYSRLFSEMDISEMTHADLKAHCDPILGLSVDGQKRYLENLYVCLHGVLDEEIPLLFKRGFVFNTVRKTAKEKLEKGEALDDNESIISRYILSKTIDLELLRAAPSPDVESAVSQIYQNYQDAIEQSILSMWYSLSTRERLNSIFSAVQAMVGDENQSVLDRMLRVALLMVISPLLLILFAETALTELSYLLLFAIKLLSVELINAPLHMYSFLFSSSSPQETPGEEVDVDVHPQELVLSLTNGGV